MNLLHKRMFIMFSVALNVGFVIMAVAMVYQHSISSRERSWAEIADIVARLKLPEAREQTVLDTIGQFRSTMDKNDQDLKAARSAIIRLLAKSGPVDLDQLHGLIGAADNREKHKNEAFEAHVIQLRNQLGDEKGALFFSLLLSHLNARAGTRHQ